MHLGQKSECRLQALHVAISCRSQEDEDAFA